MSYASLIDLTEFRTVQQYVMAPNSPIVFALHVRNKPMLAQLADQLGPLISQGGDANEHKLTALLTNLMNQGDLLFSSRHPMASPYSGHTIPISSIPATACSSVIYLPPFYLVHTPVALGLFERPLTREHVAKQHEVGGEKPRFKP